MSTRTTDNSITSFAEASWSEKSVFLSFMILWIVYGILNQYGSIHDIQFDPAAVVWSQEGMKIIMSVGLYLVQDGSPRVLWKEAREHWTLIFWYGIPAGLYALGDVLTYINLRSFDPATLHLLGEMKLVITAVVHQMLFKRILKKLHWVALGIITLGCVIKAMDSMELSNAVPITTSTTAGGDDDESDDNNDNKNNNIPHPTAFNYFLILVHILTSTVAGVYNEKLLKDKPTISINLQNICLYLDGITFLTIGIIAQQWGSLTSSESESKQQQQPSSSISSSPLSLSSLQSLFAEPSVLAVAITMAIAGIVTSRFLKAYDSIRKSVATALTVVSLPFLGRLFFGTLITAKMVVSISLVVLGMYVYTAQPPPRARPLLPVEEHYGEDDDDDGSGSKAPQRMEDDDDDAEFFLNSMSPIQFKDGIRPKKENEVELSLSNEGRMEMY